jgi:beta-glucosidase
LISFLFGQDKKQDSDKPDSDKILATSPEPRTQKWWQDRHQAKLADLKKTDKVDLLWIGDSITHSWESRGKKVFDQFYSKRNPFNIGYSGDRTEHVIWRLQNGEVEGISPKLIVIMIGTNNTGHRKDKPEHTAAGIKQILTVLDKKMPQSKVLLLGVFPRDGKPDGAMRKINVGINKIIKDFADDKKVFFLDISDKFLDVDGNLPKSVMPDALHPNEAGYKIWAEAIEPTVEKLMGGKITSD